MSDPLEILKRMQKTRYGYVVDDALTAGYGDYFSKRKDVAGMAIGGPNKLNNDPREDRAIIVNPYAEGMDDPVKREGLIRLEAARHFMDETPVKPSFEITPEMQAWREKTFVKGRDPYYDNDQAFRETVISRLMVGDDTPPVSKDVEAYAGWIDKKLGERENPRDAFTQNKSQVGLFSWEKK